MRYKRKNLRKPGAVHGAPNKWNGALFWMLTLKVLADWWCMMRLIRDNPITGAASGVGQACEQVPRVYGATAVLPALKDSAPQELRLPPKYERVLALNALHTIRGERIAPPLGPLACRRRHAR